MSGIKQRVERLEAIREKEAGDVWDKIYTHLPQAQLVALIAAFALAPDSSYDLQELEPYREQILAFWGDAEKHQALYVEIMLGVCERLTPKERALIGWPERDELADFLDGEREQWLAWHREAVTSARW